MTNDKFQMTNEAPISKSKNIGNLKLGFNLNFVIWILGFRSSRVSHDYSGQASIELTVALILLVMLLIGTVRVFVWVNGGIVSRHSNYEGSRGSAGSFYNALDSNLNLVVQP